ncbi:MAG: hypothetical protein EOP33_00135 [Rickettsiaceae bacterium]|nr:MAG: hypothetical protein EOP33_00135 [Rickettsiaceae bacterium]
MKKAIKLFGLEIELLPFIITILGVVILLYLGCWQLYRLEEKSLFIASVANNLVKPPSNYHANCEKPYSKVAIEGRFLPKNIYLYGQRSMSSDKDGYYLITPFETVNNEIILVARGWLSKKYKARNIVVSDEMRKITGIILPLEKKKTFIPDNDLNNNLWFTLDLEDANIFFNVKVENHYLLQIEPSEIDFVNNIDTKGLVKIKNDHLEYALTWFGLAISLVVIFVIYCRKKDS